MIEKEKLSTLLKNTRKIVKHHNEIAKLKGERFNIFSILNMESKENETHSAFLGELLNPKGSHLMGYTFLQQFLEKVQHNKPFDITTATLTLEKFIGKRNDIDKVGGRVDIYIEDVHGNTICIENKIYANDQNVQIERYVNHNSSKNTVYYLTLHGDEPNEASKGNLNSGEHFFNLSYKTDITNWLNVCAKEAIEQPILRETIKQYNILIKKLTHTMNEKEPQELNAMILEYLNEAEYIAENFHNAITTIKENFRLAVFNELKHKLDDSHYDIKLGSDAKKGVYSQIWIFVKGRSIEQHYGLETFTGSPKGNLKGDLFIGILDSKWGKTGFLKEYNTEDNGFIKVNTGWVVAQKLTSSEGNINLSNNELLKKLGKTSSHFFEKTVQKVCKQVIEFITDTKDLV
ncbi:PD-(D/E)XK nuclease family protein [Tenacibaculum mesophilum]|uniref:PDDEXK-like family protein n=1 Tax=Tenacibaculum mesophilum TaxID=104268 RepID=UPI00069D270C|nr:PD-(D/E)XK nuclease family protein [Tenacibaculum mesophilum]